MPVIIENHESDVELRPGTTRSDIVVFLYHNPELGYSPQEITEQLEIPRGTATTTLKRLYDDEYVGKTSDGYYYALSNRADIRRYLSSVSQANRMFGHHRDESATPETPKKQIGQDCTDEALETELTGLEDDLRTRDE